MAENLRLLLVDDDPASLHLLERLVEEEGFEVTKTGSAEEAEKIALELRPHVVITDVVLPGGDGYELMGKLKTQLPESEVMLLTGHASVERAVEAIRDGACDYIEKPVNRSRLVASLRKARQQVALKLENLELRRRLATQAQETLVGQNPSIEDIRRNIERVAGSDTSVFIEGESGTGKEIAAEMIHRSSGRVRHTLVKVSCAAIPENLLESEMFGHEKGAFTGASYSKPGKFELADRGTLFLDEIGEMKPGLQAKLLRVLQDGKISRLGSTQDREVNVRIVCATNIDVEKAIAAGQFREDLFYRINVVRMRMPALRDRLDDVPLLTTHFLAQIGRRLGIENLHATPASMERLQGYAWPGNVRQLKNVIERAVAMRQGPVLDVKDFLLTDAPVAAKSDSRMTFELGTPLEEVERRMIKSALDACAGDKEKAAAMLGISSRTIYRKLGEAHT